MDWVKETGLINERMNKQTVGRTEEWREMAGWTGGFIEPELEREGRTKTRER